MAANDAWDLQGMNGGIPLTNGQVFTGLSRGVQILETADVDLVMVGPTGATVPVSLFSVSGIQYIGGPMSSVTVGSGTVTVFPTSTDYTIV